MNPMSANTLHGGAPVRIRLSRKKGWRLPANTVVVARPSKWGNPWKVDFWVPAETAVACFRKWLTEQPEGRAIAEAAKVELKGKNLACWCRHAPCHADVLLELVNEQATPHSVPTPEEKQ